MASEGIILWEAQVINKSFVLIILISKATEAKGYQVDQEEIFHYQSNQVKDFVLQIHCEAWEESNSGECVTD